MDPTTNCSAILRSDVWGSNRCGKPFKTDEQRDAQLCGIHLAAKKRKEAKHARWEQEWDDGTRRKISADALAASLKSLGIDSSAHYDAQAQGRGWTGHVIVEAESAQRLIAFLTDGIAPERWTTETVGTV